MTMPSLPTDATYKLILIIGILLIITFGYNIKTSSSFLVYSEFKTDSLNQALKDIKWLSEDALQQIEDSASLTDDKRVDSLNKVSYGFTRKYDQIVNDSKYFAYQVKQSSADVIYSVSLFLLGLVMAVIGYRKWSKQQLIDDEIKRKQLQILDLEYQQKLSPLKTDFSKYNKR